jgi:hypothetical protein
LKAATASSRVETLPMFVRSRASRTRAERPIPGDRVLDALDRALIGAHGAALDLVAAYLSRAGTLEADESGRTLGILALNSLRRYAATCVMFRHLQSVMDDFHRCALLIMVGP